MKARRSKEQLILRGKTNAGDMAKHEIFVILGKKMAPALRIRKLVLSDNYDLYRDDFQAVKFFKGKYLFVQTFSVKLSTFSIITDWLKEPKKLIIKNL